MRLSAALRQNCESTDVQQAVLLRALRGISNFEWRGESSLLQWLAKICETEIASQFQRQSALRRDVARTIPINAEHDEPAATLPTPSVEVGRREDAAKVREAIAQLPKRYRECLILRNYTVAEWSAVGDELEISADAARVLHRRAMIKLGQKLRVMGIQ